jgi:hypothetical protein
MEEKCVFSLGIRNKKKTRAKTKNNVKKTFSFKVKIKCEFCDETNPPWNFKFFV